MSISAALLLELGIMLIALALLAAVARRVALSAIPLYLAVGLTVGEGGFVPIAAAGDFLDTGATIGVVLLLLTLGLEFSLTEFGASLRRHMPSAAVDVVLNVAPGAVAAVLLDLDAVGILALAGITWISSSGVVSRLLSDLRRLGVLT